MLKGLQRSLFHSLALQTYPLDSHPILKQSTENQHPVALISFCTYFKSYRYIIIVVILVIVLVFVGGGENSSLRYSLSMLNLLNIPWEEICTIIMYVICNLTNNSLHKLHGYTVHQQYPTLYFPINAHNVKKRRVIKTF